MLQDRTDDEAVKLRRLEALRSSSPRNASVGARGRLAAYRRHTFARNDLLFTMSDNTRMQTTRERDALHARICFYGRAAGEPELIDRWWSQTESNRRPPACKAGALPTELWPRIAAPAKRELVGLGRFELPTSRLSSARSNQLSYKPLGGVSHQQSAASDAKIVQV